MWHQRATSRTDSLIACVINWFIHPALRCLASQSRASCVAGRFIYATWPASWVLLNLANIYEERS